MKRASWFFILILLVGCQSRNGHSISCRDESQTVPGKVVSTSHVDQHSGNVTTFSGGHIGFGSYTDPAQWNVSIRTPVGKFDMNDEEIYHQFDTGDSVQVTLKRHQYYDDSTHVEVKYWLNRDWEIVSVSRGN